METTYLADGFTAVDQTHKEHIYADCLNYIDSIPYFAESKARSYELLELSEAKAVLDIGCGVGSDVLRMAQLVGEDGRVTGVDQSAFMIEKSREQSRLNCEEKAVFQMADAKALPFMSQTFDRCRIDRVLQHIPQPGSVIDEAFRILEPGGKLVIYDNDWSSFSLSITDKRVSRIIEEYWCDAFVNGSIALHIKSYLRHAGFQETVLYPSTLVLDDFAVADKIYDIKQTVLRTCKEGLLTLDEAENTIAELQRQTSDHTFMCTLTSYMFAAVKAF